MGMGRHNDDQGPGPDLTKKPPSSACFWAGIGCAIFAVVLIAVFVILGLCNAPPSGNYQTGSWQVHFLEGGKPDDDDPDVYPSLHSGNTIIRGLRLLFFNRKVTEIEPGRIYEIEGKNYDGDKFRVRRIN